MMRKLILWLSFMMAFCLILLSCVHDEIYTSSDPASKEYHSKSLWKEDEKYIKKVMKVYSEHHEEIKKGAGEPMWDYAMTMDRFNESFLMVPVAENGKVVAVLNVPRKGQRVYFTYTQVQNDMEFFQNLISSRLKRAETTLVDNTAGKLVCTTKTISMFYPDNESDPDGPGHWESHHVTECKSQQLESCVGEVLPDGTCLGGGGNDPGYPYPGGGGEDPQPEPEDPCEKIKNKLTEIKFKEKLQNLNNPSNFALNHEVGFFEKNGHFYPTSSEPCSNFVKATTSVNCLTGIMHTHQNFDCEGTFLEPVPSPEDVDIFIRIPLTQAAQCSGNYQDAYHITVSSGGTYMLTYNQSVPPSNNYDVQVWSDWYMEEYKALFKNNQYTQNKIEELFAKFLNTCIGIDGLEVYKIENNYVAKLEYDQNAGTTSSIPCPN